MIMQPEWITDEMVTRWEIQRARGDIASYPGAESVINPALKGFPDWIYLKRFDSFASAEDLNVPTLIIDAEDEELFAREVNGALLYETFALGNERHGKPSNPDFLLKPGELLEAAQNGGLRVLAYEDLEVSEPRPACLQRIAARKAA